MKKIYLYEIWNVWQTDSVKLYFKYEQCLLNWNEPFGEYRNQIHNSFLKS